MGSIRSTRITVPLCVAALALVPAAGAGAMPIKDYYMNGATGDYTPQVVHKDYSKNGATGDFTPAVKSSAAPTVAVVHHDSNFSWGAALIGAASTLLLVLLVTLTSRRVRRRRIPAPSSARPTTA